MSKWSMKRGSRCINCNVFDTSMGSSSACRKYVIRDFRHMDHVDMMSRRSLSRQQDGPPSGEIMDHTDEKRMRRSLIRSSLAPNDLRRNVLDSAQRDSRGSISESAISPSVFFTCLKLSAENKINAKNAFSLSLIDYLSYAVKSKNSPLDNFQLAGCSLDAGTKIYAARVDHVAVSMAEFAMSMSLMHKKGAKGQADEGEDEVMGEDDEQVAGPKPKKKKRAKSRSTTTIQDPKDLMMDMSKTIPKNKMFSIVGNLMDEAIDSASFSFCDRSKVTSVLNMTPAELEREKGEYAAVSIKLPSLSAESELCPSLRNFKFGNQCSSLDWSTLRSVRSSRRNTRIPQNTDSPRLTLSRQNLDPGLDEAAAQPFDEPDDFQNQSFGGDTIVEEVAACGAARRLEVLANNDDDFEFSCRLPENTLACTFSFQINESDIRPLHGPFYWKYKRSTLRTVQKQEQRLTTKKTVENEPVVFSDSAPDISKLLKKRSKTYLSRDTLIRWNPERHVLPTEDCEDVMIFEDRNPFPSILDVGLVPGLKLFAPDPNITETEDKIDDGSQKVPYDFDNEADKQDYCPFPEQPMLPSDDEDDVDIEDDVELDSEAIRNLFQLQNNSTVAQSQIDDIFSESRLLPEPANVVATVAPDWKTSRGINMRHMESLLWKQIDVPEQTESQKLAGRWRLIKLRLELPKKIQDAASVTTTFYALLNLANKKGLELRGNSSLSNVTVQRLNTDDDKQQHTRVHPALLSSD